MKKTIVFQSINKIGLVETKNHDRYMEDNKITPLRWKYVDMTKDALIGLFEMSEDAHDVFQDILEDELNHVGTISNN